MYLTTRQRNFPKRKALTQFVREDHFEIDESGSSRFYVEVQ